MQGFVGVRPHPRSLHPFARGVWSPSGRRVREAGNGPTSGPGPGVPDAVPRPVADLFTNDEFYRLRGVAVDVGDPDVAPDCSPGVGVRPLGSLHERVAPRCLPAVGPEVRRVRASRLGATRAPLTVPSFPSTVRGPVRGAVAEGSGRRGAEDGTINNRSRASCLCKETYSTPSLRCVSSIRTCIVHSSAEARGQSSRRLLMSTTTTTGL